jgi:hypothetical protein
MELEKRYVVTVDLCLYAENDLTAKAKASRFVKDAEFMIDKVESNISVVSIHEAPFGKIGNLREVK